MFLRFIYVAFYILLVMSMFHFRYRIFHLTALNGTNTNLLTLSALVHDKQTSVLFLQQHEILHNPRFCSKHHPVLLK